MKAASHTIDRMVYLLFNVQGDIKSFDDLPLLEEAVEGSGRGDESVIEDVEAVTEAVIEVEVEPVAVSTTTTTTEAAYR